MPWLAMARSVFDELVISIDENRATPGTIVRAEKAGTTVLRRKVNSWYDADYRSAVAECRADWVFVFDYDEQLSPEWQQVQWRQILEQTQLTHFWILRRWVVPGGQYIDSAPWWPDFQLRLFRTNVEGMTFPTKLHDRSTVPGGGASFHNLALHHHVLWLCSRAARADKVRHYDELRPQGGLGHFYLYEDYSPRVTDLPEPVKLDITNEVCWMDMLQVEDVLRLSFKINHVPEVVRALEMFWLNVEVTNATSQAVCPCPPFPVRLAYHWIEKATRRMILFEGDRSGLFPGLPAHAAVRSRMVIRAPSQPGEYILQITMVQEGIRWFEDAAPDILQEFVILVGSLSEGQIQE
jgi:hypothetical protein